MLARRFRWVTPVRAVDLSSLSCLDRHESCSDVSEEPRQRDAKQLGRLLVASASEAQGEGLSLGRRECAVAKWTGATE